MEERQKCIFTIKVTYNADITLTVESDDRDEAIRLASEKAQAADNSEFNIYDEKDVSVIDVWRPGEEGKYATTLQEPDVGLIAAARGPLAVIDELAAGVL